MAIPPADLIDSSTPQLDALAVGCEPLIPFLTWPDRHVPAAAIVGKADILLAFDRKDFPAVALQPHGIVVRHPDEFLAARHMQEPEPICDAVRSCRARFRKPPRSVEEHSEPLRRQRLDRTVELLRLHADRP